jgi:hypothetical protein
MFTVRRPGTGKLVTVRYTPPFDDAQLDVLERELYAVVVSLPRWAFLVDIADLSVLPDDPAQQLTELLRSDNAKVLQAAYLMPSSPIGVLQAKRVFREAGHPMRQPFQSAADLLAWLDPCLTPAEQADARLFLSHRLEMGARPR